MRYRKAPLLGLLPLVAGCFTYVPIGPEQVTPAMTIRAQPLENAGVETIEGTVLEVRPLSIFVLPEVSGGGATAPVSVEFGELAVIEERTFNQTRTALLAGATLAIGIASLYATEVIGGGGRTPGGSGDFSLIPALRIPIGR